MTSNIPDSENQNSDFQTPISQNGNSQLVKPSTTESYTLNPKDQVPSNAAYARIWLRREDEGDEAFDAFDTWLKMKLENADYHMQDVADVLGKHRSLLWRWSKVYSWEARLRAYQNNEMLIVEREMRKKAKEEAGIWYERKKVIKERGFQLGERLLNRAELLLGLPVSEKVINKKIKVGDQIVETHTTLNFNQHPRDARLFLETGIKLMRLSAEMPTDHINLMPQDKDLDAMSDQELLEYANELERLRKQVVAENGDGEL